MSNQIWQIEEKGVPQTIAVLLKTYVFEKTAGEEEKQDALSQDREEHERLNWLNLKQVKLLSLCVLEAWDCFSQNSWRNGSGIRK